MSVIANFHKYYKDTDPALDLFDVIVSIYKWFYRNMWERRVQYMETGKVIPIATSDFPGQDFGFMPMEAVFHTRSCFRTMYSNKKSAAISSEGCVIQLPDSVSEELSLTNAYSILWTGCQTHCTIPIAVNNEWGDVLYATCPIMPAEDGSTFMLDKSRSVSSLYDFSKIIIVSTLSAERRVLYNAVAGVFNGKKYVDVLSTYLQSLYKCEALSCDVKMDSHYNIISSKIVSEVTSIGKITEDLTGFPINWYNDLFDLPANTIVRALQYVVGGGRLSVQGADILLRMQKCFGNALQSIYQTYEKCDWFLPLLLYSFSYYLPYFGEIKNLQQVLGVDKPTLKEMLSEPTSDIFIFWKVMNLHSPCSYVRAKRLYSKFADKDAELMVNGSGVSAWQVTQISCPYFVANDKLRFPVENLSYAQQMYVLHEIYKTYSLADFYKWLLSECYLAVKSKKYARSDFIMAKVLKLAYDYHRMAREINPSQAFTLPHNIQLAHDAMVDISNAHKKVHSNSSWQAASIKRLVPCYRGKRGNCVEDDTYMVCQPISMDDILDEGIQLHHCVGSYCQDIVKAKGDMLIYFMRKKSTPKTSLITIQVNRADDGSYYLIEAAGENNRTTTKDENCFIEKWLVAFNENIQRLLSTKGRKNIWFDQCQDDLHVWCQWVNMSMEDAKRMVGEHPAEKTWDSVMKEILVAYAHALSREQDLPFKSVASSIKPDIAAMYGLCCMQSIKYRDFEYIRDDEE